MRAEPRPFHILDLAAVLVAGLVMAAFFSPALSHRGCHGGARARCRSKLRSVGIAAAQYSMDYGCYPHMTALAESHDAARVSTVYRTLIALRYLDNPEGLICPSSDDAAIALDDAVINNPKQFQWGSAAASGSNQKPVLEPKDPEVFANSQLSYTYRQRVLWASRARSDSLLTADKALREEGSPEPGGNHGDGFNVGFADGHVGFVRVSEPQTLKRLAERLIMGPFDPRMIAGE